MLNSKNLQSLRLKKKYIAKYVRPFIIEEIVS